MVKPIPITHKPAFPWWGNKTPITGLVWELFGDVDNYIEPFFGSGAMLFRRPTEPKIETVNDIDQYLVNMWRALKQDPESVIEHASYPVSEVDLYSRHIWLLNQDSFRKKMWEDPDYYDAKIAGWWLWGVNAWIGSEWCSDRHYGKTEWKQALPHIGDGGRGINRTRGDMREFLLALADRLKKVRIVCGDWKRVVTPATMMLRNNKSTAVFLDPPYGDGRNKLLYGIEDAEVAQEVSFWAKEYENKVKIILCGYEGDYDLDWRTMSWKTRGGFANTGNSRGKKNSQRETIWISPSIS